MNFWKSGMFQAKCTFAHTVKRIVLVHGFVFVGTDLQEKSQKKEDQNKPIAAL